MNKKGQNGMEKVFGVLLLIAIIAGIWYATVTWNNMYDIVIFVVVILSVFGIIGHVIGYILGRQRIFG
ncbi:MAG: hypothetical protein PHG69_06400 [Candidatus Omnitrophica bacterium]|nr:hypothetical protein [Candidatus Omnitrophota bacterium]